MADNRKSHITAKVAAQCSEFYKTALKHLNGSSASGVFGSSQFQVIIIFLLTWTSIIENQMVL